MKRLLWRGIGAWLLGCLAIPCLAQSVWRPLTLEDRIQAQEAIERVYYRHQLGAKRAFEAAVPRSVVAAKVRSYLDRSVALEHVWHTPVTGEGLRRELERIARDTRFPERLLEVYAALDHDPVLIQECFARPALVERLSRRFFAADERIHSAARNEAVRLQRSILDGSVDVDAPHPYRSVAELVRRDAAGDPGEESGRPHLTLDVSPGEFERWRASLPQVVGEPGDVREQPDGFVVQALLEESPRGLLVGTYRIPKVSWQSWWDERRHGLGAPKVGPVAMPLEGLPRPGSGEPGLQPDVLTVAEALTGGCVADDTWDNGLLDGLPEARWNHTAVWTGTEVIVWGGFAGSYLNTGGRYDPLLDAWTAVPVSGAPAPRHFHTAVWTGTEMVVWGGSDDEIFFDDGARYDPVAGTWSTLPTLKAPSGRDSHTAVWTGTEMVVWGGFSGTSVLSTGANYNPSTDKWATASNTGEPSARDGHAAVWTGSRVVVWGGDDGSGVPLASGARYDPVGNDWFPLSGTGTPSARSLHAAVWSGTHVVIWGGASGASLASGGGRYDPAGDSWTSVSTSGEPAGRLGHSAVWTGSRMVVWGGEGAGATVLGDGARYDPSGDAWSALTATNAPDARTAHTGVWTGDRLVVWGGTNGSSGLNSGGRYDPDPVSEAWTPTAQTTPPTRRYNHTAVWTGNRMVVWGGTDGASVVNTGGRYDALLDNWSPTATALAPSSRSDHTAVWTGERMVVWGGQSFSALGSGRSYDPIGDAWSLVTATGAPSARHGHTAVWTGSEMLVWGGTSGSVLGDGARYDPDANLWTPLSTTSAPTGRYLHTAVWTGTEMVVWGGFSGTELDTGGRYVPSNDTWAALTTTDAPSARRSHTAVWTGDRMIVWGGLGGVELSTGGRYEPATNSWTATATSGAPSQRSLHTASWTGNRMLVWGGRDDLSVLGTGGRYDVLTDTWTPMSSSGPPAGRRDHTAVWANGFLVVWGGQDDFSAVSTGGRYALGQSTDQDGDGLSLCTGDCDDSAASVYPGAPAVCDGVNNDCLDPSWPAITGTNEVDDDGDGFSECQGDCDDQNGISWALPDEIPGFFLEHNSSGTTILTWSPPLNPGTLAIAYDVLRSAAADDFGPAADCLESDDTNTLATDSSPPAGGLAFYLVRAQSTCPSGEGTVGDGSAGPRSARTCP